MRRVSQTEFGKDKIVSWFFEELKKLREKTGCRSSGRCFFFWHMHPGLLFCRVGTILLPGAIACCLDRKSITRGWLSIISGLRQLLSWIVWPPKWPIVISHQEHTNTSTVASRPKCQRQQDLEGHLENKIFLSRILHIWETSFFKCVRAKAAHLLPNLGRSSLRCLFQAVRHGRAIWRIFVNIIQLQTVIGQTNLDSAGLGSTVVAK